MKRGGRVRRRGVPGAVQLIQPPAPSTIIPSWLRSARTQLSARIARECVVLVVAIRALIGNGKVMLRLAPGGHPHVECFV